MKVIALGDNSIDIYRNTKEVFPGGNAVNTAVHAAAVGADAEYLGYFGDDCMAKILIDALRQKHVDISACPVLKGKTTKACCYEVTEGERHFLNVITGPAWTGPIQLTNEDLRRLSEADIIISSCNAKLPEQIAKTAALPPVFAFDFGEKEKYRTADYYDQVCGSGMDLAMLSCSPMTAEDFRLLCQPLHERGVVHVLATMGAGGQMFSDGERIITFEPERVKAKDTMGAGDAFLAGFTTALFDLGWRKGVRMEEEAVRRALKKAAGYAAANCMQEGGIGIQAELTEAQLEAWEEENDQSR